MNGANGNDNATGPASGHALEYVTVNLDGQWFGIPITRVQDVFLPSRITPVPRAPREVSGLLNLRGKVMTAICLRRRLEMSPPPEGSERMAVGVEQQGDPYGFLVDEVGEVLHLTADSIETAPPHLDRRWSGATLGIHRLEDRLLVILDVDALLDFSVETRAA